MVRTMIPMAWLPHHVVAPHLDVFDVPWAKEIPDHTQGPAHRLASGGSRPGPLWRVSSGPNSAKSCSIRNWCATCFDRLIALRKAISTGRQRMTDKRRPNPSNPYAILALAIVLPGSGHVFSGVAARGLQFLFFMIVIGWATSKIAPEQATFIGRYAGGFFIYALSILDAYKIARIRYARRGVWLRPGTPAPAEISSNLTRNHRKIFFILIELGRVPPIHLEKIILRRLICAGSLGCF